MVISLLVCWIIGVGMLSKYIFVNEKLREIKRNYNIDSKII